MYADSGQGGALERTPRREGDFQPRLGLEEQASRDGERQALLLTHPPQASSSSKQGSLPFINGRGNMPATARRPSRSWPARRPANGAESPAYPGRRCAATLSAAHTDAGVCKATWKGPLYFMLYKE